MTEDYWHKVGGQRWLGERLMLERKKLVALERIADALELLPDLLHSDNKEELRTGPKNKDTEETQEGR